MTPYSIRELGPSDAGRVAHVLRASFNERLPWLSGFHSPEQDLDFVKNHLFQTCSIWGTDDDEIFGFIAFKPRWVEQLYILPERQRRGAGHALLTAAKKANVELNLWTFQRNTGARMFYEREGFVAVEQTDGQSNEEREPDVLYRWRVR